MTRRGWFRRWMPPPESIAGSAALPQKTTRSLSHKTERPAHGRGDSPGCVPCVRLLLGEDDVILPAGQAERFFGNVQLNVHGHAV